MSEFVQVAVNVPGISDVFDYHLLPEMQGKLQVGHLVRVPFGRQEVQGVICGWIDNPSVSETRPVSVLLDPQPVTTALHLQLARELSQSALMSLAASVSLMIPAGLEQQADAIYTVVAGRPTVSLSPLQTRLLKLLDERGPLRGSQIDHAMPRVDWRKVAKSLGDKGLLKKEPYLAPPAVRPKQVRTARLAVSEQAARDLSPRLGKAGSEAHSRRLAMLEVLIRESQPLDVSWIYAESGGSLADLRKLEELGLVQLGSEQVWRNPLKSAAPALFPTVDLTDAQKACWEDIANGFAQSAAGDAPLPYLLHGVTGSGKTELYLRSVEACLLAGRQAIVLVPEIALTPQTVNRFLSRFPGRVGLLHSQLSQGERYDTWRRAQMGLLDLVVGPRSALFTPFPNPGLLVLDESHDDSYYQDEPPFYDARSAALILARLARAVLIFGSATPDIVSKYQADQGRWHYLQLPERVRAHQQTVQLMMPDMSPGLAGLESDTMLELPPVDVVDMRLELQKGNRSMFSQALQMALAEVMNKKQQAIVFLNRRGTATYVFCRDCGYSLKCPRCEIPLTYHGATDMMLCHRCGYKRRMPETCPSCNSMRIRQYGAGTERVEAELKTMFEKARLLRWDYETTRKKGAHEAILSQFISHQADILIGTQMLAKGLDLPLVTLVGVVLADPGLNLPDYRATERTFQLLTQVAGRAGRSPLGGRVIVQSFQPEHYVIQAAAQHDFDGFYHKEIEYRRLLRYPPFSRLVRLEMRGTHQDKVEAAANQLAVYLRELIQKRGYQSTDLIGPVPCFFTRISGIYRWQIILRGPDPAAMLKGSLPLDWRVEVDPPSLL